MNVEYIDYRNELILIVDDEEHIGKIHSELLNHLGFKAHHVCSAPDALIELAKEKAYTFLITDISMPEMDGLELTRKVKNSYPDICSIVMTGYTNEYKYTDVINAGATDFINKPFQIDELEAKIRRGIIERNTRQELERLSITDSLTGLFNQRHFYCRLNEEILRAKRQNQQIGLIMFDLDDFKRYNDEYGHQAGNEILQKFGNIIKSQIRQGTDSAYRYGGDEFTVILGDAGLDTCKEIRERIESASLAECGISVSAGYEILSHGMEAEQLVKGADDNLYQDKNMKERASNLA